jgi:hypothetical protein
MVNGHTMQVARATPTRQGTNGQPQNAGAFNGFSPDLAHFPAANAFV